MKRALLYTGFIALGFISGMRWAHAGDHMMARVERALVEAGFDARGYAKLDAPAVEYVEFTPGNVWGSYSAATKRITLSNRQPSGCISHTLAHELAHHAADVMALVPAGEPDVKAVMERISAVAEAAIDADDYAPNCGMRRGAL